MSLSTDSAKLYDVQITFHSAHSLPVADIPSLAADPYILASLRVPSYTTNDEPGPPPLLFRTRTLHKTREPDWGNEVWRIGGVPDTGFALRIGLRDEDAGKKDDRLGEARVSFFGAPTANKHKGDDSEKDADLDWGSIHEGLDVTRREAPVKKRRGGARAFMSTYITAAMSRAVSAKGAGVVLSVRVMGLSENQKDRRVYTLGPNYYSHHFSPLLGRMMGTKPANASNKAEPTVSSFQANKLQLTGPVPKDLEHKYVGYRPFIEILFSKDGIKGKILNRALKKQHKLVYSHDQATVYGSIERHQHAANANSTQQDSNNHEQDTNPLAAQFLHMLQHGAGHRLHTYVITLDAQWRFTETGDEFAIEMLSKHSMHADAARYIAYSGEMFVRRIGTEGWEDDDDEEEDDVQAETAQETHSQSKHESSAHHGEVAMKKAKTRPPSAYELVIDNDSGTYRPHKELLPLLAEFLGGDANLGGPGGIGKITAMDGFDEHLKEIKKRRAEAKNKQGDGEGKTRQVQVRRGSSVSSIGTMSSDEVEAVVRNGQSGAPAQDGEGHERKGSVGAKMDEGKEKVQEERGKLKEVKEGLAAMTGGKDN